LAVAVSIALRAARGALEEAALDARVPWPRWWRPNVCQWLKRSIGLTTRGSVPLRGVGSRRLWGRPTVDSVHQVHSGAERSQMRTGNPSGTEGQL